MKSLTLSKFVIGRSLFGALVLALLVSILGPASTALAFSVGVSVTPGRPQAVANDGTGSATFTWNVHYQTLPAYALFYITDPSTSTVYCRFYDMATHNADYPTYGPAEGGPWNAESFSTSNCFGVDDQQYIDITGVPDGTDQPTELVYTSTSFNWTVPNGSPTGIYTATTYYYNYIPVEGGGYESFEGGGLTTFLVTNSVATITLRKFDDKNANGDFDGLDSWITTAGAFVLCVTSPFDPISCKGIDATGTAQWANMPTGLYTFTENTKASWGRTTPAANFQDTVTAAGYSLSFGNANSDMKCNTAGVAVSAADSNERMTYTLHYDKLWPDYAKAAWVKLYFTNTTASPALSWSLYSSSITPTSGNGSSGSPYLFNLGDITTTVTDGTIDVVLNVASRPTSGSFIANQSVGSTYEPASPNNNTCSRTLTFGSTAVNASSFTASPQASGIQLRWWADVAGTDWVGFKLQSKPHTSVTFTDVQGAFIPANLAVVGGTTYSYLDSSAQSGPTDYQVVPLKSGSQEEASVLSLTTGWHKIFAPRISN